VHTPVKSLFPKTRTLRRAQRVPALYAALFEIAAMKKTIAEIRNDAPEDAERIAAALSYAESTALRLIEQEEKLTGTVAH
jgi:hypothetical protein